MYQRSGVSGCGLNSSGSGPVIKILKWTMSVSPSTVDVRVTHIPDVPGSNSGRGLIILGFSHFIKHVLPNSWILR